MNKKEISEPVGMFSRIVEKYTPEERVGEAVEMLEDTLESPDTVLAVKTPGARLFGPPLVEALESREEPRSASVRTSEKLLLNLTDCRLLTGLSDANLRNAIKAGTLKAKIIGRGYKVKRQDLDEFINSL